MAVNLTDGLAASPDVGVAEDARGVRASRRRVRRVRDAWPLLVAVLVAAIVYHAWFTPGVITAGDFPYITLAHLRDGAPFPSLWDSTLSLGSYSIISAPMFPQAAIQGLLAYAGIGWSMSERIVWIIPALLTPCIATYALSMLLFQRRIAALVSALAVVMNSYVYLLYEGGQFGVVMGYGCMPLILWAFIRGQRRGGLGGFVLTGVVLAVQALYDIRSTYIILAVLCVYGMVQGSTVLVRRTDRQARVVLHDLGLPHLGVTLVTLAVLHAWWIVPALFVHQPALPTGYSTVAGVRALSQMHIANGLSLFHPFWYANDQRVAPVNPVFYIVPLLTGALLLRRRHDTTVLFLMMVALIAVFLVKGDNDPAGGIYDWLFTHLPGFLLFRDSSKFFQPLAVADALLLGFVAAEAVNILKPHRRFGRIAAPFVVVVLAVLVAVFPAYPAFAASRHGALAVNAVPADFTRFNHFIDSQPGFFRVLWVPARPRFGAYSALHPAIDTGLLSDCCVASLPLSKYPWSWLGTPGAGAILRALSVRYIVVPDDVSADDYIGEPWETSWMGASPMGVLSSLHALFPHMSTLSIGRLHILATGAAYPELFTATTAIHIHVNSSCALTTLCVPTSRPVTRVEAAPASAANVTLRGQAHYDARLHVTMPVYLVLQQAYDPDWLLYLEPDGRQVPWWTLPFQRPVAASDHVIANGYANAWLLHNAGTYHVVLVYWPQWLVSLGQALTLIVIVIGGAIVLRSRVQRRWPRPLHHTSAS